MQGECLNMWRCVPEVQVVFPANKWNRTIPYEETLKE